MKKHHLTSREKIIFTLCIALLGIYGIVQFVIKPLQQYEDMLDRRIHVQINELKQNQKDGQAAVVSTGKYSAYEGLLIQNQSDEAQMRSFVSAVQQAAGKAGINLQNFQPVKTTTKSNVKRFSLQMTIEGPWESLSQFFHLLQDQPQYVILDELALERFYSDTPSVRGRILISQIHLAPSVP